MKIMNSFLHVLFLSASSISASCISCTMLSTSFPDAGLKKQLKMNMVHTEMFFVPTAFEMV